MIFIGEIHNEFDAIKVFINDNMLTGVNFIQIGNFAANLESNYKEFRRLDELLKRIDNLLYLVRGSHDNPIYFDGSNSSGFSQIKFVKDNSIYNIENKNVFFLGGALNIEKKATPETKQNIHDEKIPFDSIDFDNFSKIDIVVTYIPPPYIFDLIPDISIIDTASPTDACLRGQLETERDKMHKFSKKIMRMGTVTNWVSSDEGMSAKRKVNGITIKLLKKNEFYELKV